MAAIQRAASRSLALGFALGLWLLAAPVQGQTRVYLAEYAYNNPKLKTMLLDGSSLQELIAPPSTDWLLVGLDYHEDESRLFWTHGSTPGLIRSANADGSGPQLLVSGLKIPRGIALDRLNGTMYWSEAPPAGNAMGLIRRANQDGTGIQTIYTQTPYDPVLSYVGKPLVDPVNGYVYFHADHEIRRVKLDGTGPVQTVVRGLNTATALALDTANDRIFFLDANTNSDILGTCRLNDTGFAVILDNSPGVFQSSGFFDLVYDSNGDHLYFTDELQKNVRRIYPDGSGLETIYTGPSTHYPTGLTLDLHPPQEMQDCNDNGIRDLDDIDSGFSEDCNENGIPDECEDDPCAPEEFSVDQGSDPSVSGRSLSGNPSTGYEVFQPFSFSTSPEVPGVTFTRIGLDGWTVNYDPAGFRATIFPDDGSGTMPDETQPLAEADLQFRFSPDTVVWVYADISVFLPAGRYYVRLTANTPQYEASVNVGTSGENSFSRKNSNGQIYYASYPIAMRLKTSEASGMEPGGDPGADPGVGPGHAVGEAQAGMRGLSLDSPWPNPVVGSTQVSWRLPVPGFATLTLLDPAGRMVRTLHRGWCGAGDGTIRWDGLGRDGRAAAAGVYFLRLDARGADGSQGSATERLVVLR